MRRERSLWTLLACQGVLAAGMAVSFPFFALYLNRARGLSMGLVGLLLSLMVLVSAFSQGLGGELSDLWGAKPVLELALTLRGLSVAAMALAMHELWPVWALVLLHLASSFFGSFFDPALRSWIAEEVPPPQRVTAYGRLRVAMNLGWAVGPAAGGILAARSYALMFAVSAGVCAFCLLTLRWGLEARESARGTEAFSLRFLASAAGDRRFLEFCAYSMLIAVVMAQLIVSLSVHSVRFAGLSEAQVGLLFALNGLVVILTQSRATAWMRDRPLSSALAAGSLLYGLGYGWVGLARGFFAMALSIVVVTLGEVLVSPGLPALAANLAPPRLRGRYQGFQGLSHQLGSALGPLLGGVSLQYLSPRWPAAPWLVVAGMGAAAAFGFYRLGRLLESHEEGLEAA